MAGVLFDLCDAFNRSKTKPTRQEVEAIRDCVCNSIRDGAIGACLAGGVAGIASRRLSGSFINGLVVGVGFMCGMWSIDRSFYSSLDHMLSEEGRMKNELARIMAQQRYRNDPRIMKLLTKHFSSEKVFDDSTSDRPELMFRQRNAYINNAAQISRSPENYGHDDSDEKKKADSSKQRENNDAEKVRKAVPDWMQANDGLFDSLVDHSDASSEEVVCPSSRTKRQSRRERRIHRRRRRGDSSTMDNA